MITQGTVVIFSVSLAMSVGMQLLLFVCWYRLARREGMTLSGYLHRIFTKGVRPALRPFVLVLPLMMVGLDLFSLRIAWALLRSP